MPERTKKNTHFFRKKTHKRFPNYGRVRAMTVFVGHKISRKHTILAKSKIKIKLTRCYTMESNQKITCSELFFIFHLCRCQLFFAFRAIFYCSTVKETRIVLLNWNWIRLKRGNKVYQKQIDPAFKLSSRELFLRMRKIIFFWNWTPDQFVL